MAKEDIRDDVRRVAIHYLIKQVGWVVERIGSVPARENVAHDPDPLASIFCGLQLPDHETERAREIRVVDVDEVVEVAVVPEIGIQGDDSKAVLIFDRIRGVVQLGFGCRGVVNPAVVLP